MSTWTINEQNGVDAGVVTISEEVWPELSIQPGDYVKVTVGRKTKYLSAFWREATQGHELFVKSGTFKIAAGVPPPVSVEKVSARRVRAHLLFKTKQGWGSIVGLVLALTAIVAQTTNSLDIKPSTAWTFINGVAQGLGLLLVFGLGVANRKLTP